jgi:hypothetical protein
MKTIRQHPHLAYLFGAVALATAVILIVDAPKVVTYLFAIFWFITGLLGLYSGKKR